MSTTEVQPRLQFRLRGEWYPLVLPGQDPDMLRKKFVKSVGGAQDAYAAQRALLSEQLRRASDEAVRGEVEAMFVCAQLRSGVPMPINLTVIARPDLHMSPAIGVSSEAVLEILEKSFEVLQLDDLDSAVRVEGPDFLALRMHRTHVEERDIDGEIFYDRSLVADYWYTVPGTKNVLLVNFITPMGDIPHIMLQFFDAIVKASYFEIPEGDSSDPREE